MHLSGRTTGAGSASAGAGSQCSAGMIQSGDHRMSWFTLVCLLWLDLWWRSNKSFSWTLTILEPFSLRQTLHLLFKSVTQISSSHTIRINIHLPPLALTHYRWELWPNCSEPLTLAAWSFCHLIEGDPRASFKSQLDDLFIPKAFMIAALQQYRPSTGQSRRYLEILSWLNVP